ncbi:MAG TPA: neocarzinostatin apoprotein domain-containing protein [Acidimicrobiales bacterium]|nr:neocarzinostatin apoprotein domain-containing protein [Acidimicrobiales bacterium]
MRARSIVNTILGVVLMGSGVLASEVLASAPAGATKSHPRLVVRPSGSLKNSQTVKVRGLHFTPNDAVYLVECLAKATGQAGCDISTTVPVTINAKGAFGWTKFKVKTGDIGTATCGTKRTDLKKCAISAGNVTGGDSTVARITFVMPSPKNKGKA